MISVSPDQLSAAGSYIARNWGESGYYITDVVSPTFHVSLFTVRCGDGSEFIVGIDRWGNAGGPVESHGYKTPERTAALQALTAEMHAKATAI